MASDFLYYTYTMKNGMSCHHKSHFELRTITLQNSTKTHYRFIYLFIYYLWKTICVQVGILCSVVLTRNPLYMELRGEVVPHLRDIAVFLARQLDTESIRLQWGSGCSGRLDRLIADGGRCDFGQSGLLRACAVSPPVLMVEEHARSTPHVHIGTTLWHGHWHLEASLFYLQQGEMGLHKYRIRLVF